MQVKRLIELLSALDPEAHVFIGDDNADTEVEAARSNGYRVLLTGDTSLYGLGYDDGYDRGFKDYPDHPYDSTPTV